MQRVWNRVLNYVARLGAPGTVRRTAIVTLSVMALISATLGYIGWAMFEQESTDVEFDFWTRVYRTQTLFTGEDGSLMKVPWPLDVARLLAPLVLFGFGALAVFNLASARLQRWGVRRAKGHVLYLGQPARLDRLRRLLDGRVEPGVAVYAVPDVGAVDESCLRVAVDLDEDDWPMVTSAESASAIVIAVNDDDRAVALATLGAEQFPDARLVVDVVSEDTMRWLALWMMTRHPGQRIEVISVDRADAYAQAELGRSVEHDAMVLTGSDLGALRIVDEFRHQIAGWAINESIRAARPLLFVIDPERPGERSDVNDAVLVLAGDVEAAVDACAGLSTRVLALGRDGMTTALRIAAEIPGAELVRLDSDGFDGQQLRDAVAEGPSPMRDVFLYGPLHALTSAALSIADQGFPTPNRIAVRSAHFAHQVAALSGLGWSIHVSPPGAPFLPRESLDRMARDLGVGDVRDCRALTHGLGIAGFHLRPPPPSAVK